jgi:transcriptional regulator with XRE-family HTH domain
MFRGIDLRDLREQQGLTRDAVSARAGISRSTLSRLESGLSVPTIETLLKLANSLDLPFPKLLSRVVVLRQPIPLRGSGSGK